MHRRRFITTVTASLPGVAAAASPPPSPPAPAGDPLTILHLTDIHIRPEHRAPERCARALAEIRRRHPEIGLVVNTGDSIYAADYANITRERMLEQWAIWDEVVVKSLNGIPSVHCIGNHDPWWAAPEKEKDEMHGIPYVCKRLGISAPYAASRRAGWEIITLDNSNGKLGPEQQNWLFRHLDSLPAKLPILIASHLPILSLAGQYDGGNMGDAKPAIDKLATRQAPVLCLSGHIHLQSSESIWNLQLHCNGALSGYWWEPGEAGDGSYKRTPAGYAIVRIHPDGRNESTYFPLPA
ncbi:MAG: metallophosphoesterase [Akkermansiaceae bacterium]|jgi:3',5'-cyclic AMP phosphodiesterase CpdA|nr:metallophosphoesterase [Akkermansiaceae bacterium]